MEEDIIEWGAFLAAGIGGYRRILHNWKVI